MFRYFLCFILSCCRRLRDEERRDTRLAPPMTEEDYEEILFSIYQRKQEEEMRRLNNQARKGPVEDYSEEATLKFIQGKILLNRYLPIGQYSF